MDDRINKYFEILNGMLEKTPLDTERSGKRTARAGEFMYMHDTRTRAGNIDGVAFKHCDTRNYLFIHRDPSGWKLVVPKTDIPFKLGFFDTFKE